MTTAQAAREPDGYGVDHVNVAEGLSCKAIRVTGFAELAANHEDAPSALFANLD